MPSPSDERREIVEYYERGDERDRLTRGVGLLEYERTKEIVRRHLPVGGEVADVGGGPGRYALWLAGLGFTVHHRDLMPLHVAQLTDAARDDPLIEPLIDTAVCDARSLDLADASVDAVVLLGPMYHLRRRQDRLLALREARRVVRPGAPVFVAVISRWAARVHGMLVERLYLRFPDLDARLPDVERSGVLPVLEPADFTGYCHRPGALAREVRAAGLELVDLVSVEGPASLIGDLDERLRDPLHAAVVMSTARALERVPELIGIGPHLLATARRPPDAA